MASLYEIDRDLQAMIDSIFESADENGEVEVDFSALEELKAAREVKLENIALYIKNCEAEALAIKNEENTLAERRKRLERKCERLEALLLGSMIAHGETELSSPRYVAKIRNSEVTEIDDGARIPDAYIIIKSETKPDKAAIKKAIKAGEIIEGVRVVSVPHINIK